MSLLESIIYGLVSGLSEFLPVSSQAHQVLMLRLFGLDSREPVRDLLVHLAALAAVIVGCWGLLARLRREGQLAQRMRRSQYQEPRGLYDMRLVKTAAVPLAFGLLAYMTTKAWESSYLLLALFILFNGVLLYIPERLPQGNKDAKSMSALDAILIGLSGIASSLTGISRVGTAASLAVVRGADRQHAINWALLLSIPALAVLAVTDVLGMFGTAMGAITFSVVLGYIASAAASFLGGYLGIMTLKSVAARIGLSGFAYYSWGLSLLTLVLYLIA